jgi:PKD repeat protein
MVWDNHPGGNSEWIYPPGFSFDTPSHKYPEPGFTPSPQNPSVDQVVEFIDNSKCYNVAGGEYPCRIGGGSVSYQWDFDYDAGEGFTPISNYKGSATTTYATSEAYTIMLRVKDDLATCSADRTINVTFPLPEWEEGAP